MVSGELRAGVNSVTVLVKGLPPNVPVAFGITSVAKAPGNVSSDQRTLLSSAHPVDANGELRFAVNSPTMLPDLPRWVVAYAGTNSWTLDVERIV